MATEQRSSGGNGFLYFAIGALIVAVAVLGWMFYGGGGWGANSNASSIERSADALLARRINLRIDCGLGE